LEPKSGLIAAMANLPKVPKGVADTFPARSGLNEQLTHWETCGEGSGQVPSTPWTAVGWQAAKDVRWLADDQPFQYRSA